MMGWDEEADTEDDAAVDDDDEEEEAHISETKMDVRTKEMASSSVVSLTVKISEDTWPRKAAVDVLFEMTCKNEPIESRGVLQKNTKRKRTTS